MAKKDNNRKITATAEMRQLASRIADARRYTKEWKAADERFTGEFRDLIGGDVDVTILAGEDANGHPDGPEVATVTESTPNPDNFDYKRFFTEYFEANPTETELRENYRIAPRNPTVTVHTSWQETPPPNHPQG